MSEKNQNSSPEACVECNTGLTLEEAMRKNHKFQGYCYKCENFLLQESEYSKMSLLKRIYYLNIKSQRGRNWLGMFWLGVLMLILFPFSDVSPDAEMFLGPIFIIVVSYLFACSHE